MTLRIYDPRVLAIDLRFQRSGFAIYEGPRRLLDYGTTAVSSEGTENSANTFSDLLKVSLPSIIVVKKQRWEHMTTHPQAKRLVEALVKECAVRKIELRILEQKAIRSTFHALDCETKAEISSALSRFFPNLVWQLPPKRRAWESEHPRQRVFDAIALGFVYWQQVTTTVAIPVEQAENEAKAL